MSEGVGVYRTVRNVRLVGRTVQEGTSLEVRRLYRLCDAITRAARTVVHVECVDRWGQRAVVRLEDFSPDDQREIVAGFVVESDYC